MLYPAELLAHTNIFSFFCIAGDCSVCRLGGRCSIQLSYWRIFTYRAIVTENSESVNKIREIFSSAGHILSGDPKEVDAMTEETNKIPQDLDDWIFSDEEYQPSQR